MDNWKLNSNLGMRKKIACREVSRLKMLVWWPASCSRCPDCFQPRELDWEEPEQSGHLSKLLLTSPFLMRWRIQDLHPLCSSFASVDYGDDDWHETLEL